MPEQCSDGAVPGTSHRQLPGRDPGGRTSLGGAGAPALQSGSHPDPPRWAWRKARPNPAVSREKVS